MSDPTLLDLGEHFAAFVRAQVSLGHYETPNDVVRAGLRLLEAEAAHLTALRVALIEGEESGTATDFDFEAFVARKRGSAD